MTLLLAAVSRSAVVLAADGLCTKTAGRKTLFQSSLQKIFSLPHLPIAIAHHGQNIIGGRNIGPIVSDFVSTYGEGLGQMGLEEVGSAIADHVGPAVKSTIKDLGTGVTVGLWVAGFGAGDDRPAVCEVFWEHPEEAPTIERWPANNSDLVYGGDGKEFVNENDDRGIGHKSNLNRLCDCLDNIYAGALTVPDGSTGPGISRIMDGTRRVAQ